MTMTNEQYMTGEDARARLDAWAAEQNEVAQQNERTFLHELIEYAMEHGVDLTSPGGMEDARLLREKDVVWADTRRAKQALLRDLGRRGGRQPKYDKPLIREMVMERHENYPKESWLDATLIVSYAEEIKGEMKGVDVATRVRKVRDYCRDLRWDGKRKVPIAAIHHDKRT